MLAACCVLLRHSLRCSNIAQVRYGSVKSLSIDPSFNTAIGITHRKRAGIATTSGGSHGGSQESQQATPARSQPHAKNDSEDHSLERLMESVSPTTGSSRVNKKLPKAIRSSTSSKVNQLVSDLFKGSDPHSQDQQLEPTSSTFLNADATNAHGNHDSKNTWVDTFTQLPDRISPEHVLFINAANKNLIESDFVRTIDKKSTIRPFARVIPLRDPQTLEKKGSYYIVFHDKRSLDSWRSHVARLETLSWKYTMRSLSHPEVPPQQDFSIKGEKIDQLVKSYALLPAGVSLQTNWNAGRLSVDVQRMLNSGGHKQLVSASRERLNAVLLRITGIHSLELADVLQSIIYDGKQRNLSWDIKLSKDGIEHTAATRLREEEIVKDLDNLPSHAAHDEQNESSAESTKGSSIPDDMQPSANAIRYHDGQRWVVYFRNLSTAHRFARTWNRRPLPLPPSNDEQYRYSQAARKSVEQNGGSNTMVSTEVLW